VSRFGQVLLLALVIGQPHSAVAQTRTPPSQTDVPRGNAESGRRAYLSHFCHACHGTVGQGTRDGVRLAPNPPALATIVAYVRRPSGQMPPYTSRVISDQELANIYAFLRTIPAPPPTSSIPLLNQ
jgi:mono/diheme cytochrome c family protein